MSARTVKGIAKGLALAAAFVLPAFAASSSSPAPAFQLSGRGGKTIDLSQFKGQVVMINFWATWCVPCRTEMPLLEDIYKKYKPMGFTMLGVNVEPKTGDPEGWLSKLPKPVTFPVAFDVDSKVSKLYKVAGMPTTIFIDRKGNVREVHKGYKAGDEDYYLTQIRSLLKE
ncbi:MAG TPA: TlpA disulfide reductase family protein [Steroidobacteraceae bacterium]|jgi:thiol-disulfide isomerase/thioredoxin|nr:TlpA disulfide reductase family protein [Steroidobacteraceae bacterium]